MTNILNMGTEKHHEPVDENLKPAEKYPFGKIAEAKLIKSKLKRKVQALMTESEALPHLEEINQDLVKKVCRLERCVVCWFRYKTLLLQKVQVITRCKATSFKDKPVSCLEKELRMKIEATACLDKSNEALRSCMVDHLNQTKDLNQRVISLMQKIQSLGLELQALIRRAAAQDTEIRETRLAFEMKRHELVSTRLRRELQLKENGIQYQTRLLKCHQHQEELKERQRHLNKKRKEQKDELLVLIRDKTNIIDRKKILQQEIKNKIEEIEKKTRLREEYLEEISKLVEHKAKLESDVDTMAQKIEGLMKELKDLSVPMSCGDQVKESKCALNQFNELKNRLIEENDALQKNITDLKTEINDESHFVSVRQKIDALYTDVIYFLEMLRTLNGNRENVEKDIAKSKRKHFETSVRLEASKRKSKEVEDKCNKLMRVNKENAPLRRRIAHLEETYTAKDEQLQELKTIKSTMCFNYAHLLEQAEEYEKIIARSTNRIHALEGKTALLTNDIDTLAIKETQLKAALKRWKSELKTEQDKQSLEIEVHMKLEEKLQRINELYTYELDNNEKLKTHIKLFRESNSTNLEEVDEVVKKVQLQKTSLEMRQAELTNEYNDLVTKYNIAMKGNGALAKIIKDGQSRIENRILEMVSEREDDDEIKDRTETDTQGSDTGPYHNECPIDFEDDPVELIHDLYECPDDCYESINECVVNLDERHIYESDECVDDSETDGSSPRYHEDSRYQQESKYQENQRHQQDQPRCKETSRCQLDSVCNADSRYEHNTRDRQDPRSHEDPRSQKTPRYYQENQRHQQQGPTCNVDSRFQQDPTRSQENSRHHQDTRCRENSRSQTDPNQRSHLYPRTQENTNHRHQENSRYDENSGFDQDRTKYAEDVISRHQGNSRYQENSRHQENSRSQENSHFKPTYRENPRNHENERYHEDSRHNQGPRYTDIPTPRPQENQRYTENQRHHEDSRCNQDQRYVEDSTPRHSTHIEPIYRENPTRHETERYHEDSRYEEYPRTSESPNSPEYTRPHRCPCDDFETFQPRYQPYSRDTANASNSRDDYAQPRNVDNHLDRYLRNYQIRPNQDPHDYGFFNILDLEEEC